MIQRHTKTYKDHHGPVWSWMCRMIHSSVLVLLQVLSRERSWVEVQNGTNLWNYKHHLSVPSESQLRQRPPFGWRLASTSNWVNWDQLSIRHRGPRWTTGSILDSTQTSTASPLLIFGFWNHSWDFFGSQSRDSCDWFCSHHGPWMVKPFHLPFQLAPNWRQNTIQLWPVQDSPGFQGGHGGDIHLK